MLFVGLDNGGTISSDELAAIQYQAVIGPADETTWKIECEEIFKAIRIRCFLRRDFPDFFNSSQHHQRLEGAAMADHAMVASASFD